MKRFIGEVQIQNPLPKVSGNFIADMLTLVFGILGGISLIMLVWAGMKYVLSAGDPAKTAEAKNQIMYAMIGIAVALSAGAIVFVATDRLSP